MLRKLSHSLSFRLVGIFLLLCLIFGYGSLLAMRWVYSSDQLRELVSGHLALHIDYVKDDIGHPPDFSNALLITQKIPVDIRIVGKGVNWASDEDFPQLDDLDFGGIDVVSVDAQPWLRDLDDIKFAGTASHKFLKIVQDEYFIIVSSPRIADTTSERSLLPVILLVGILTILGSFLAVHSLFKPIHAIRQGANKIGRGDFSHRVASSRADELGDLANDINDMANEVESMLDAKRQLLFGISHELRSPLSRMNLALEIMPDAEALQPLKNDIDEMESIISVLLEAERLNERHAPLTLVRTSARELTESLITSFFSEDAHRIRTKIPPDLSITVDEARTKLMLKNLISNALRYIDDLSGYVELEFSETPTGWLLKVRDNGSGYPEDLIDQIGEPFFRIEASRSRHKGYRGLGLYLTKSIAKAHGGSLYLDRTWQDGACFVIELPFE